MQTQITKEEAIQRLTLCAEDICELINESIDDIPKDDIIQSLSEFIEISLEKIDDAFKKPIQEEYYEIKKGLQDD